MKKILLVFFVLISNLTYAKQEPLFDAWCDTFQANSLVSSAANRIFGRVLDLNKEDYDIRVAWVNKAYELGKSRFYKRTGLDYDKTWNQSWVNNCQLKDSMVCQ